ncbi:hypothetical protein [Allokutzneria sp. NRRL B-24872]|nr:hypothetical protein [Allokutzneria sp. NRRL B-24872]
MASTGTREAQWPYQAAATAAHVSQAVSWQVQASSVDADSPP